jgi:hypothetical protein
LAIRLSDRTASCRAADAAPIQTSTTTLANVQRISTVSSCRTRK